MMWVGPKKNVWSKPKQHQKNVCTSPVICGWAQINIIEKWTGKTLKQEMSQIKNRPKQCAWLIISLAVTWA